MSHTCRVMKATREAGVPIPPLLSLCEDDRSAKEYYAFKHLTCDMNLSAVYYWINEFTVIKYDPLTGTAHTIMFYVRDPKYK